MLNLMPAGANLIDVVRGEDLPVDVAGGAADALWRVGVVLVEAGRAEVAGGAARHGQQEGHQRVHQEEAEGHRPPRVVFGDIFYLAPKPFLQGGITFAVLNFEIMRYIISFTGLG